MADILVFTDSVLLTIVVSGVLLKDEILHTVRTQYPKFTGRMILWDLEHADIAALSAIDFAEIARVSRELRGGSGYRKTAYVTAIPANFTKLFAYANEAVAVHVPAEYCVFRSVEEAKAWLMRA